MEDEFVLTQSITPHQPSSSRYKYAMICSSNINRSMEAHTVLQNDQFDVESFGVGKQLRLPGPQGPRCFEFGTPYSEIAQALIEEAHSHYKRVRVLDLAERASRTKLAPQRWQDTPTEEICRLDVVIVFEARLYETVLIDLQQRDPVEFLPLHLICMDTRDSPKDAIEQSKEVLKLCREIERDADLSVAMCMSCLKRAELGEIQYTLVHL